MILRIGHLIGRLECATIKCAIAHFIVAAHCVTAQTLLLPDRPAAALSGTSFLERIAPLDLAAREQEIISQVASGNVPLFLRKLCPVQVSNVIEGRTNTATFYVTPDYLAIGSDEDYFLTPISPHTAQKIADTLNCSLPTPRMVDQIYTMAEVKLAPSPIPPSPAMTTVGVFSNHNATVRGQRAQHLKAHPLGALVAGHKKDVVISAKLATNPGRVAIYGWHQTNGRPIQPFYLGHLASWVDYSQCTRLVQQKMMVNGVSTTVEKVLGDPSLAHLLNDEGMILKPRYPTNKQSATKDEATVAQSWDWAPPPSEKTNRFGERTGFLNSDSGVRICINSPAPESSSTNTKVLLIFYALPNGNTIDQTLGKALKEGDDWHYDIQHIGAQTRFLRRLLPHYLVAVAYLENNLKSWPAWRTKYGDQSIPEIVQIVTMIFTNHEVETVLSSHSGGGSFMFGYCNALQKIPDEVIRIAFLDSNYAYDRALGHKEKLSQWLRTSEHHHLCVLAYNDAVALLDGKPFVSAAGGTWGSSHAMLKDLSEDFQFSSQTNAEFEKASALDGRVQFILKENPEKKIFHTVQVERNGFIHSMVSGTTNENKGYEYFGARAYSKWIATE